MRQYQLTKQALKNLKKIVKSDRANAARIKSVIDKLAEEEIEGRSLQGFSQFKKIRIGKYRLIYADKEEFILITIIEKRETVYQTFEHLFRNINL